MYVYLHQQTRTLGYSYDTKEPDMTANKLDNLRIIAFDADDTLWVNEPYFRESEERFCALLEDYLPHHTVNQALFKTEMDNLRLYGYGIKGFMLSMIETILTVTEGTAPLSMVEKAIEIGKEMLDKPIELLEGVEQVLQQLQPHYQLVVATKGDLLDQERKLQKSGLASYFHHVEIMSEKKEVDYQRLLHRLNCSPEHFLMIGNTLKSDVLPVISLNARAIHIPFHVTWQHETISHTIEDDRFFSVQSIQEILPYLLPTKN